jgi:hypothetical protein
MLKGSAKFEARFRDKNARVASASDLSRPVVVVTNEEK